MNRLLTFQEFIHSEFEWFTIDKENHQVIKWMHLWAWRDEKFEQVEVPAEWQIKWKGKKQSSFFLEKGFLLLGSVGTGKTIMLRLLNEYLKYLESPYVWFETEVWAIGDRIAHTKEPNEVLSRHKKGNWLYDELALLDEESQKPLKEMINIFGNKVLVGDEIVRLRYNIMMRDGWVSSFTSNQSIDDFRRIYSDMFVSRLLQMCNVIPMIGTDRRINSRPVIMRNMNKDRYAHLKTDPSAIASAQDDNFSCDFLNEKYKNFISTGSSQHINASDYLQLQLLGVDVCCTEKFNTYLDQAKELRRQRIKLIPINKEEHRNFEKLSGQYATGKFDEEEKLEQALIAKKLAVVGYFENLKSQHKQIIF